MDLVFILDSIQSFITGSGRHVVLGFCSLFYLRDLFQLETVLTSNLCQRGNEDPV